MPLTGISFVVAIAPDRRDLLQENLLASPAFENPHTNQIIVQEDFPSAAKAYNDAIDKSHNDLMVFLHSDIILPQQWIADLQRALSYLDRDDPEWGVLGSYGETLDDNGRGYIYSSGLGIIGKPFERPQRIQTLDEIVLILRKSSGLRFDEALPHFHMYGTDICMTAEQVGRRNYAVSTFCIHNTQPGLVLADEFYECYRYMKRKWKKCLPIQTTCIRITRFGLGLYTRRLLEAYLRYIRRKTYTGSRAMNIAQLLRDVDMRRQAAG